MPKLNELQTALLEDIYHGTDKTAAYLSEQSGRLSIYVNNTLLTLTDVLANSYPVLQHIVGEEFFKTLARDYIKSHAQNSGDRHQFGLHLAAFLSTYSYVVSLPYLSGIAEIEWAVFQSAIAKDVDGIDINELQILIMQNNAAVIAVHPSVHVIESHYNILDIWQAHQHEDIGEIALEETPNAILVWRNAEDEVQLQKISHNLAVLIQNCQKHVSFLQAMQMANPDHDLQAEFSQLCHAEIFINPTKETL